MNISSNIQIPGEVILIDHTGARHSGEGYDAMQALRDAEEARPIGVVCKPLGVVLAEVAALSQSEDEVLWPDWNREIRGKEWG